MKTLPLLLVVAVLGGAAVTIARAESSKIVERDFGRLSTDAASAFDDIHLARLAIFDGKTDEAGKLVIDAQASLARAKTDEAAFMKAEASFHRPRHIPATTPASPIAIVWIPIDSEIVVGASFAPSPETAAAIVTARKGLAKGDGARALQAISAAAADVNYTLAVAPLEQSIATVDRANMLIAARDYYAASQALREAEAAIRYDEIEDVAQVAQSAHAKGK